MKINFSLSSFKEQGHIRCLPRGCISVCAKWQERVPLLVRASVSPAVHIQSMLERSGTRAVCMA